MKCPHCPEATLVMSDRQGVEIDYCPSCRGVWLDRGELDKLIERSAAPVDSRTRRPEFADSDHHRSHAPYGQGHQRKKSWLSDIFD